MSDVKEELHDKLRSGRAALLSRLDGLGEYERRTGRPAGRRETTLGFLLIRMVSETAQHAGHADILRELIDGTGGPDQGEVDGNTWREYLAAVEAAADRFRRRP